MVVHGLELGDDVFEHDDGIGDQHAGGEADGQQGRGVQGLAGQLHEEKADEDGDRHGDGHDDGGADVDEEDEQDEGAEQHGLPDAFDGGIDGGLDVFGLVRNPGQLHAAGQGLLDFLEAFAGLLDDGDDVALGLLDDLDHDARPAVENGALADFGGGLADGAEIVQLAPDAVAVDDFETGDVGDVLVFRVVPDGELVALLADAAAGQGEDALLEDAGDVGGGQPGRGEGGAVEFDPHFALVAADDLDFADARDGGEAVGDGVVGVVVEVVERRVAGKEDVGDGLGVDVDFLDDGPFGVFGQVGEDAVEFFADVLGGDVHVHGHVELEDDLGDVLEAGGLDVLEAVDAGDGVFDVFADVFLDVFRRGADPGGDDGDVGDVDRRHVFDGQLAERIEAEGDEGDEQAAHRDRALRGGVGEEHGGGLLINGWRKNS